MRLRDYVIRRVLLLIPVLIGVSIVTFALTRAVAGPFGPASVYIDERCGQNPACVEGVIKKYGFDQPYVVQYVRYIQSLLSGGRGYSQTARTSAGGGIGLTLP